MVSDGELEALVDRTKRNTEELKRHRGEEFYARVLVDKELRGLISDLAHHRESIGNKLVDLYGGDAEAALKFLRELRNI